MSENKRKIKCWEHFHCMPDKHKLCLLSDSTDGLCWQINISCCKMDKDTPNPLSVKKVICKSCEYYKIYQ